MKSGKCLISVVPILLLSACQFFVKPPENILPCPSLTVYFSPKGGATEVIAKELDNAKTSILMQAYSFTSAPIAKALVAAHERGVKVEIILDKSNLTAQYTSGPFVAKAGIPTRIDSVTRGSFIFTKAPEKKIAENFL